MPVMLAVMEIPGCLVGLYLVSQMRHAGMDRLGNMPHEPGYDPSAKPVDQIAPSVAATEEVARSWRSKSPTAELLAAAANRRAF